MTADEKFDKSVSGDLIDLGPGLFTDGKVINYNGDNYYKACDAEVSDFEGGGKSYCVKRVDHHGHIHENYDGKISSDGPGEQAVIVFAFPEPQDNVVMAHLIQKAKYNFKEMKDVVKVYMAVKASADQIIEIFNPEKKD